MSTENTPIATEAPTTTAVAVVTVDDSPNFEAFSSRLQQVATLTKELQTELKQLQRQFQKLARSKKAKKTDKAGASPSGFAKPTPLSNELCAFLSLSQGSELSRTSVTRLLNQYIKDNKLQNPDDKRTIIPDDKLKALLRLGGDEKVTYFNLQSFMKPHYVAKA